MTEPTETGLRPPGPLSALGLAIIAAVVAVDQITKAIAEARLDYQHGIELLPILALYRVHNTGVAFSFAHGFDSLLLVGGTALITLVVLWLWATARDGGRLVAIGFALITGGAIGNLIDRATFGYVIDYILFHTPVWSFAIFNLADAFITVGAGLVLLQELVDWRRGDGTREPEPPSGR